MSYQEFNHLHDAVKAAVEQGATRVGFNGSCFNFERRAKTVEGAPATCVLFLNSSHKWQLDRWYVGTGGHIELNPMPEKALLRAIAEAYFTSGRDNIPLPRSFQTEDGWQFHLTEEGYKSVGGEGWSVDEIMKYLRLPPEDQLASLLPDFEVKSWTGDSAKLNWDEYAYSPKEVDMRLSFWNKEKTVHYVGVISWEGEIVIESSSGATIWSEGDRLTVEDINQFPEIRAESRAYCAAVELGIKVTHREEKPDCGTYCIVEKQGNPSTASANCGEI